MIGIFDLQDMDAQVNQIYTQLGGNWGAVHTITVGNEFILAGKCSPGQMTTYTTDARAKLRAKGYSGPVVSVNVAHEVIQNPSLCDGQDYIAVNCHAFFDGGVAAEGAGAFLKNMRQLVSQACGGKYTMITGK